MMGERGGETEEGEREREREGGRLRERWREEGRERERDLHTHAHVEAKESDREVLVRLSCVKPCLDFNEGKTSKGFSSGLNSQAVHF